MRNKKLISRILVMLLSILIMLTSIPFNLLTAFADGGAGGGFGGSGGSVSASDNPINDEDIGLRFSLVTKDASGKTKVVPNIYGKYYLDVWNSAYFKQSWYKTVNSYSRYAPLPTKENIKYWNADTFDNTIETAISSSGKGEVDMGISNHMVVGGASASTFFTEGEGGLKINGDLFYNWFMKKVGKWNGKKQSRYFFFMMALYNTKMAGINMNNTFLVVEPVLHIANPTQDGNFALTGTEYIASWYGYVDGNLKGRDLEPGCAYTLRDRFSNIANNFRVTNTEYLNQKGMKDKMWEVLGIQVPATLYTITGYESIAYGNGKARYCRDYLAAKYNFHYRSNGFAMQIFWLKDSTTGIPIDTFDIINKKPNYPSNSETPSEKNQTNGDKTIIKMYVDLYKDPKTGLYTQIVDKVQYAQKNVSEKITITDEHNINGYNVSAWYTSRAGYKNLPKGSSMFATTDIGVTDGTVKLSSLGGKQLRINNYTTATGYASANKQKYYAALPGKGSYQYGHGTHGKGVTAQITNRDAVPYTTYKRLAVSGTSSYGTYDYKVNDSDKAKYIELGDSEKTLVVLYTREMNYISTDDYNKDIDISKSREYSNDKRKDKSGEITVVKLYGTIDPSTYKITDQKSVTISHATRNVNINNEPGYNFAEWIYVTKGKSIVKNASVMGDPSYCSLDGTIDQAYRLDGFVDGFKNNASLRSGFQFNNNFPVLHTITGSNGLTSAVTPGRYSIGSRSGIGTKSYNSTIYFGGTGNLADNKVDSKDDNDVLYLLFLKTDSLSYSADDLVIPESYITRYDNYKHNPMKVTGSVSGKTRKEYLQAHKFKYLLPVITGVEYKELNPLFIPHIELKDKEQVGLINTYSSVQRLQLDPTGTQHEIIKAYGDSVKYGMSDYAQLVYIDHGRLITSSTSKKSIGNMLNVSALNLEYTAYRAGDKVTLAMWKHSYIGDMMRAMGTGSKLLPADTGKLLGDINTITKTDSLSAIFGSGVGVADSVPATTRKQNDSTQNFKLDFSFSEVGNGAKSIYLSTNKPGGPNMLTELYSIDQPKSRKVKSTTIKLFRDDSSFKSYRYAGSDTKILSRAYCADLSGGYDKYEIKSLNRLYSIKQSDNTWKTATGKTTYLDKVSDISITQNVQYDVHYGSSISNPYTDDTKTGNGTDNRGQYGYVKSMKAANTISFYPYYAMQYELPSSYNSQLKKNGTEESQSNISKHGLENNANQVYVIGEEQRYLNVYDCAEVSFRGHTVSSTKGTDVVNNIINTDRKGRIEISSEQWSTHARANSLIGLDNCALPGGATLSITIPNNNRQTVTITSYSAFLPKQSAGYAQVASQSDPSAFGSMPTNTNAASERHKSLVASVVAGFEGLNVEQYFTDTKGYTNTKDHGSTYDSADTVYNQIKKGLGSGKNLYDIKNSYSVTDFSNKEDKYYYRPDGDVNMVAGKANVIKYGGYDFATGNKKDGQGNTGDFDTDYTTSNPSTTYYTFYMNRVGQVLCIEDTSLTSSAMANVTGTARGDGSVLVAEWSPAGFNYASGLDADIKRVATATGIVDELYKQLQEGTGSDESTPWSKDDGQWYFEAFDGITIAKFETKLRVGFIDPYERTSVLDPAVIPNMQNKGDMLTSTVASQIVTSNTSLKYGTANKIGEFCDASGNKIGDIIMPDLRSFFISDVFFAPNITVQDLK